jgi:sporulation protein YlmC with PRC-barrel domain
VAGLLGSEVFTTAERLMGTLEDLVVHWNSVYPPLVAAIVRRRQQHMLVQAVDFVALHRDRLVVRELPEPHPAVVRAPYVQLGRDLIDRQIVDVDGADVTRVSDLVLVPADGGHRLGGVDISARTLARRAGPTWLRRRVAADRIFDWATVAAVSPPTDGPGSPLQLTTAAAALRAQGPAGLGGR